MKKSILGYVLFTVKACTTAYADCSGGSSDGCNPGTQCPQVDQNNEAIYDGVTNCPTSDCVACPKY